MIRALPILALAGCSIADRFVPSPIPPGDSIRLAAMGMVAEPPPECANARQDWYCGDHNLDGGVDGADLEAFVSDWTDCLPRSDCDGDGMGGTDCDMKAFLAAWYDGEAVGCF